MTAKVVVGRTLELMRQHVDNFPTDDEIKEKYHLQKTWDNYKVCKLDCIGDSVATW
jgi:hypothetical protein